MTAVRFAPGDYIRLDSRIGKLHAIHESIMDGYVVWVDENEAVWLPLHFLYRCNIFEAINGKLSVDVYKHLA